MQYIITAYDGENALEQRLAARTRHLEGVKALGNHILCAGGLLDDERKMNAVFLMERWWGSNNVYHIESALYW